MPTNDARGTGSDGGRRTANDQWKSRWGTWLQRSMIAAAVIHGVLFILFPVWNINRPERKDSLLEVIQINPIAGFGGITDPGEGVVAALPTEEEIELARLEAGQITEDDEAAEVSGVELPAAAYAFVPSIVPGGVEGEVREKPDQSMILDKLAAISPDVIDPSGSINWPQIRNPTVISRFLRSRFNEIHRVFGASGYVSIAMWVDERGGVEWARVSESSGDDRLDGIALDLFEEIVAFAPARNRGRGVPVQVTISVPFTLPW